MSCVDSMHRVMNVGRRRSNEHDRKQSSGGAFKQMVAFGAACITREKQAINDLNVFPVPDGDTGTNMSLTIADRRGGAEEERATTRWARPPRPRASALLRGARGNSGVILSLLFRGLWPRPSRGWRTDGRPYDLAAGHVRGRGRRLQGAVMKPAEGTVLTVSRHGGGQSRRRPRRSRTAPGVCAGGGHCRTGYDDAGRDHGDESGAEKGRGGGRRRQGLPHDSGGDARAVCGASPCRRWRRSRSTDKADFAAIGRRGHHLRLRHRVHRPQERSHTWIWTPSGPIWTASATVWSSARTTKPSRSTSTPTSPARL